MQVVFSQSLHSTSVPNYATRGRMGRKPKQPDNDQVFPNRIREIREARGWTLQALADAAGLSKSALGRIETGESDLKMSRLRVIAKYLDVRQAELLEESERPIIKVVGQVVSGGQVQLGSERAVTGPLYCNPDTTVALEVSDDALMPMVQPGWFVFFSTARQRPTGAESGDLYVTETAEHQSWVRRLSIGHGGRWNLLAPNGHWLRDQKLLWVAPIMAMLDPKALLPVDPENKTGALEYQTAHVA